MKALKLRPAVLAMTFLAEFALVGSVFSAGGLIQRLDLFDAQENHLMYVTFEYDNANQNTGYSVFFSDGVFTRKVFTQRNTDGMLVKEAAVNCVEDTVFKSTFTPNGANVELHVTDNLKNPEDADYVDQLALNWKDGKVSYSKPAALEYLFSQNGANLNKITYENDNAGKMKKVNIFDNTGTNLLYYGLFDAYTSVMSPVAKGIVANSSINLKGNNVLAWKFTLDRASKVKFEALSLSGRRVAVLFSGNLAAGRHAQLIRLNAVPSISNGVYVAVMSIDDKPAFTTKIIVQRIRGGVR